MTDSTPATGALMLDAEALYQTLARQIERIRTPETQFAGITSGGAWLAQRLQQDWGLGPVGTISTAMHRDDFAKRGLAVTAQTQMPFEVDGAHIILLDDVLYTGRTVRAALNEIFDYGLPASVKLAVLVDRGHRELPIRADYVGKNLPTSQREQVRVLLSEVDGEDAVLLGSPGRDHSDGSTEDTEVLA